MRRYPVAIDDLVVIQRPEGFVIAQVVLIETIVNITKFEVTNQLEVAWHDTVIRIPPRIAALAQKAALLPEAGKMIGTLHPTSNDAIMSLKQYVKPEVGEMIGDQ